MKGSNAAIKVLAHTPEGVNAYDCSEKFIIGKSETADLSLNHDFVSRRHLYIVTQNDMIQLIDLESANGTYVNGVKLEPNVPHQYKKGEVIHLGNKRLAIQLEKLEQAAMPGSDIDFGAVPDDSPAADQEADILSFDSAFTSPSPAPTPDPAPAPIQEAQTQTETAPAGQGMEINVSFPDLGDLGSFGEPSAQPVQEAVQVPAPTPQPQTQTATDAALDDPDLAFLNDDSIQSKFADSNNQLNDIQKQKYKLMEEEAKRKLQADYQQKMLEANEKSLMFINQAKQNAQKIVVQAKQQAQAIVHGAQEQSKHINNETNQKIQRISTELQAYSKKTKEKAEQKYTDIIKKAETNAKELMDKVTTSLDKLKTEKDKELARSQENINDLRRTLENLEEQKQVKDELISKVTTEVNDKKEELDSAELNLEKARLELKDIETEVDRLTEERKDVLKDQSQRREEFDKYVHQEENRLRDESDKARKDVDQLFKEKQTLMDSVDGLSTKKSTLESDVKILQELKTKEDLTRNEKKAELNKLQNSIETLTQKKFELIKETDKSLENVREDAIKNRNEALKLVESAKLKERDAAKKVADLEKRYKTLLSEFQEKQAKTTKELADLTTQVEAKQKESASIADEIVNKAKEESQKISDGAMMNSQQKTQDADEYSRKMRQEADEYFNKKREEAEAILNVKVEEANKYENIIATKKAESEKAGEDYIVQTKSDADAESRRIIAEAQKKAQEMLESARDKSDSMVSEAESKSSSMVQEAESKSSSMVSEAESKSSELLHSARSESDSILSSASQESNSLLKSATDKSQSLESEASKKYEERLKKIEQDAIAKMAFQEEESKKRMEAFYKKEEALKAKRVKEVYRNIKDILIVRINKNEGKMITPQLTAKITTDLQEVIKRAFGYKVNQKESIKGIIFSGNTDKVKKFWLKVALSSALVISVATLHFSVPTFFPGIKSMVMSWITVEESASDLFIKRIEEARKNKPKYNPILSRDYKASYTDNILFTASFIENVTSKEFQKAWIVELNDLFVNKFKLSENTIVSFNTKELRLISELFEIRTKIKPERAKKDITKMRAIEKDFVGELTEILGGKESNYRKFAAFRKRFYEKHLQNK